VWKWSKRSIGYGFNGVDSKRKIPRGNVVERIDEMAKRGIYRIEIFEAWCKRCGICAAFCPENVLEMDAENKPRAARPEDCSGCGLCEIRCPDFAISVQEKEQHRKIANPEKKTASRVKRDVKPAGAARAKNRDLY